MNAEIRAILDQISKTYALFGQPHILSLNEEFVEKFKDKFQQTFKCSVDLEYLNFLKECDGIDYNGYSIYSSSFSDNELPNFDIFSNYKVWNIYDEFKDFIVIGDSDLDLYIYNKVNSKYEVRDRGDSKLWESYDTFDSFCIKVLNEMIN